MSQNAAKYAIIDFGAAAEGWGEYRRRVKSGRRVGFPRFKRRKHEQGLGAGRGESGGQGGRPAEDRPGGHGGTPVVSGSIREVAINRTAGTWFASLCVEDGEKPPPVKQEPAIGVGVGATATCSDGTVVENPKALATALKMLRRMDKAIARSRNVHGQSTAPTGGIGCTPDGQMLPMLRCEAVRHPKPQGQRPVIGNACHAQMATRRLVPAAQDEELVRCGPHASP